MQILSTPLSALLKTPKPEVLSKWLVKFVNKTHRNVGEVYPPKNDLPDVGTLQRYILTAITNGRSYEQ